MNERRLKIILPIAILALGLIITMVMVRSRPPVATRPPQDYAPLVRAIEVRPENYRVKVRTQGTVRPRTETELVSEVAGRVVQVAPSFAAGGFFEKGDILVWVDPRDYETAVIKAEGDVARAKVLAELEEARAEVARKEWEELGEGEGSPLVTRELQLQEALAALSAAEAALDKARRDLGRTRIRAPYAGRVRDKMVDVGQYVTPGMRVASIFAIDYVEVRLPIPDAEIAYLDLPSVYRGEAPEKPGPDVLFYASFANKRHEWRGRVVRVEGEIDPVSRMVHVVAQVDDPYGRGDGGDPVPFAIGLFVQADIFGREVDDAVVLPRSAVRSGTTVLVIDDEDRLRFRDVDILRLDRTEAVITGGLAAGERVCISSLEAVTDGMRVRTTTSVSEPAAEQKPTEARKGR